MEDHTTEYTRKGDRVDIPLSPAAMRSHPEHNKRFIGRTLRVLVDGESKHLGRLVGKDNAFIMCNFQRSVADPELFQNVPASQGRNWAVLGELTEGTKMTEVGGSSTAVGKNKSRLTEYTAYWR